MLLMLLIGANFTSRNMIHNEAAPFVDNLLAPVPGASELMIFIQLWGDYASAEYVRPTKVGNILQQHLFRSWHGQGTERGRNSVAVVHRPIATIGTAKGVGALGESPPFPPLEPCSCHT